MTDIYPFRSEEEEIFWGLVHLLPDLVEEFNGLELDHASYESLTFHFGQVSYTPDFVVNLKDPLTDANLVAVFEIKGSKKQKGYKEIRQRLNTVAGIFTEYVFVECLVDVKTSLPASFEIITRKPFVFWRKV